MNAIIREGVHPRRRPNSGPAIGGPFLDISRPARPEVLCGIPPAFRGRTPCPRSPRAGFRRPLGEDCGTCQAPGDRSARRSDPSTKSQTSSRVAVSAHGGVPLVFRLRGFPIDLSLGPSNSLRAAGASSYRTFVRFFRASRPERRNREKGQKHGESARKVCKGCGTLSRHARIRCHRDRVVGRGPDH